MADRLIHKHALLTMMREAGFRRQQEFANAIGLSSPKLTNILNGARRAQIPEAQRMAATLKVPLARVLAALTIQYSDPWDCVRKIDGSTDREGIVKLYVENSDQFGATEVMLPYFATPGIFIEVQGDGLLPRYSEGDVLGVPGFEAEEPLKPSGGDSVIAKLAGGPILLREYQQFERPSHYALLSFKPYVAPILDPEIEWVFVVECCFPRLMQREKLRFSQI